MRCVIYANKHCRDYDFFSPLLGIVAFVLGVIEIAFGGIGIFVPATIGTVIFMVGIGVVTIAHGLLGWSFALE